MDYFIDIRNIMVVMEVTIITIDIVRCVFDTAKDLELEGLFYRSEEPHNSASVVHIGRSKCFVK